MFMRPREQAAEVVYRWLCAGDFPDRMLDEIQAPRAFVTEVVLGVVRWYRLLTWVQERVAPRPPRPRLRSYMLTGFYELLRMDAAQPHATVAETVESAKTWVSPRETGFLNAVLRRVAREREALLQELGRQPDGVRLSHPDLLLERWARSFGAERARRMCAWNNQPARVTITVCTSKIAMDAFRAALRAEGIEAEPHAYAPERCLTLPRAVRVRDVPGYDTGWFTVQDPSTLLSVALLAAQPGHRVLDACAAPGGKTLLIADGMRGEGEIRAGDRYEDRLARLRENIRRCGWSNILVECWDAADADTFRTRAGSESFDRILLDVPCTNTGVIRRRPDAKWRFSLERLGQHSALQWKLLSVTAPMLKPSGRLVYSTCSVEAEENNELTSRWLEAHPAYEEEETRELLPGESGTDGAYAACLRQGS